MIAQSVINVSPKRVYIGAKGVDPEGRECNWATIRNVAGAPLFYGPRTGQREGTIELDDSKTFEAPGVWVWSPLNTKIIVQNGD